jgi:hypothetical protein
MSSDNTHNLPYFESPSMRARYDCIEDWQVANRKRLLSICVQQDGGRFCCIALSNPTEVVIVGGYGNNQATVTNGYLYVSDHYNQRRG